ncbi:replicative DNA helicase, partial [Candidatus Berkelbacteria bacterium]|nr:replicative DNA helicase [Candidatus Berkelbacteria bacterium]
IEGWKRLDELKAGEHSGVPSSYNSHMVWHKIDDFKPLGTEEVYDATVPVNYNFVANDVIVHNSIEQDSDVVMFIYREDYYEPKTERKNLADILIRKHRHGPVGQVELYFVPEQMTFRDIERKRGE